MASYDGDYIDAGVVVVGLVAHRWEDRNSVKAKKKRKNQKCAKLVNKIQSDGCQSRNAEVKRHLMSEFLERIKLLIFLGTDNKSKSEESKIDQKTLEHITKGITSSESKNTTDSMSSQQYDRI